MQTKSRRSGTVVGPAPSLLVRPPEVSNSAGEAIELAESAGLVLDPWQRDALVSMLGEGADGKWSALEACVIAQRQNGKGAVLEARELAGLILFGEELIIHSAHLFPTALEAFSRVDRLIDECDDLRRRVRKVVRSHGEEGLHLRSGARLLFRARTKGSGRGFTGDCVVLDEVGVDLPASAMAAMMPTLSARPNPQVVYTSTVPGVVDERTEHLLRLRRRALSDSPGRLSWIEWSAQPGADLDDRVVWQSANPAWGIRISEEFTAVERASLTDDAFASERLGIWPPDGDNDTDGPIDLGLWDACVREGAVMADPVVFAVDASPSRDRVAVVAAGRWDGGDMVEIVHQFTGPSQVVEWIVEACGRHDVSGVVVDGRGPASTLIPDLEDAGVPLLVAKTDDVTTAAGRFVDAVGAGGVAHRGEPVFRAAVAATVSRPVGERWAFARRSSRADVSPVVAGSLALWALQTGRTVVVPKPVFAY